MNYEERVVVFLDILGFKELIDATVNNEGSDNESAINHILDLYQRIRQNWDLSPAFGNEPEKYPTLSMAKENAEKGKIVTIFSDSVVISFPQTAEGEIFWTLMEIRLLLIELAHRGFLCRGAVSSGKLLHNENIVFGPALVEAYQLESKKAIYPRVLVSESILELVQEPSARMHDAQEELDFIHDLLIKDDDGYHYIDFVEKVQGEMDEPEFGYCDYLMKVRSHIVKGLVNPNQNVKAKFEWLKDKFNITVQGIKSPDAIKNLLAQGRNDMVTYYGVLNII